MKKTIAQRQLCKDPAAVLREVQAGRTIVRARARTAQGDERDDLWNQLAAIYPPYNDYQKYAGDREIPVVVLEPLTQPETV